MSQGVHCLVSGRVQGVYFRACTRDEAVSLGLTGWVRNLPGRRVEVMAFGEPERLDALLAFLRQGSPLSRVDEVKVEIPAADEPVPGDFTIRY